MTDNNSYSGSCLCASVKYEILGLFDNFFFCHCKYCQKDTGTVHAANLFGSNLKLSWLAGENSKNTFNLPGTRHTKCFCQSCGSALPYEMEQGTVVCPAGSLDVDITTKPTAHIFYQSRANWEDLMQEAKRFPRFPA